MKYICIIALKQLGLHSSGGALYLNLWPVIGQSGQFSTACLHFVQDRSMSLNCPQVNNACVPQWPNAL
jgi:hypothetical protein